MFHFRFLLYNYFIINLLKKVSMKKNKVKRISALVATNLTIFLFLLLPFFTIVSAQQIPLQGTTPKLQNPLGSSNTSLTAFANSIVDAVVTVGLPIAALMIVYSGFLFVKARGNPSELEVAKRAFFYALVGIAIILGAKVLSEVIKGTIDVLRS